MGTTGVHVANNCCDTVAQVHKASLQDRSAPEGPTSLVVLGYMKSDMTECYTAAAENRCQYNDCC